MEATRLKQSENESCLTFVMSPQQTPPTPTTPPFKVMDATHHCALWRDDHWVQRSNNGIADRESRSHGLPWLHHLSCTCGLHPRYIHATEAPGARVRARRALLVSKDPIVLSWKDCALSRMLQWEQLTHLEILRLFSLPVTLMGNSTLRQENACDEGIIGASEHVSGYYCNTLWWHS